jgi:hypothetical protein
VLESVRAGTIRICSVCHKEKNAKFFPYKSRSECYLCYEKVAGVTLHTFREEISRRNSGASHITRVNTTKPKPHRKVVRQEVDMEMIISYLRQRFDTGQSINVYYKDDEHYRTFSTFTYDDTYLRVPASAGGYNIMYRLDRIRNIKP